LAAIQEVESPGHPWQSDPRNGYRRAPIAAPQGYNQIGFPGSDARILLTTMLMLNDSYDGASGTRMQGGSTAAGFGRAPVHWPSSTNLTGPWGWGWHTHLLQHHETFILPIGGGPLTGVRQWKGAVTWSETDLSNVADIDFAVYDKGTDCTATPTLVAQQTDYDIRNKLHLRDAQVSGRCLEMHVYGYNVPAEGRVFYMTDYYHGGTPD
jgi:hypothetical protein